MKIKILTCALALTACDATPVVSDFNGSSVKIQTSAFTAVKDARVATQAEADRICGKVGKLAEYASSREVPDYVYEHLYLCL